MEAKVLFDFVAENENELNLIAGLTVTIINSDVGNGWYEGMNQNGEKGYFPANYIEFVNAETPVSEQTDNWDNTDDWTQNAVDTSSSHDDAKSMSSNIAWAQNPACTDNYLAGKEKTTAVPDEEKVTIIAGDNAGFYYWKPIEEVYTVTVESPEKLSKFAGVKSFLAYRITPSFDPSNSVLRRYKHFDWLHQQLTRKFYNIPIPPLPAKQLAGNYEVTLIEERMIQLQKFVNWISRHPVLGTSTVWKHFLTVSEANRWKEGKRRAEKDCFVGAHFLATVDAPTKELLSSEIVMQIDESKKYFIELDAALKATLSDLNEISNKNHTDVFQKLYNSFTLMAKAMSIDETRSKADYCLSNSVAISASTFENIMNSHSSKLRKSLLEFNASITVFRGILSIFPKIFTEYQRAQLKRQESIRLTNESKMSQQELLTINRRTDVMFYAIISEMHHFRTERDHILNRAFQRFFDDLIQVHTDVIESLKYARAYYD